MGDPLRTAEEFEELEAKMFRMKQAACPVTHTFGPGIYIREVRLPAGSLCLGIEQRFSQMNIFVSGKILMVNLDGSTSEMVAPKMFVGSPGRKLGYALEEVVWLNVYATEERDVETLENTYLKKSDTKIVRDKVNIVSRTLEYNSALKEIGTSEEEVQKDITTQPVVPLPFGTYKIGVFPHGIEGRGVFATADIEKEEVIAPAAIGGVKTPVGRFTNHSGIPNAKMTWIGSDIYLVSIKKIQGTLGGDIGEEITTDYKETREEILCQV